MPIADSRSGGLRKQSRGGAVFFLVNMLDYVMGDSAATPGSRRLPDQLINLLYLLLGSQ